MWPVAIATIVNPALLVKINGLTKKRYKLTFKSWYSLVWNNSCPLLWHLRFSFICFFCHYALPSFFVYRPLYLSFQGPLHSSHSTSRWPRCLPTALTLWLSHRRVAPSCDFLAAFSLLSNWRQTLFQLYWRSSCIRTAYSLFLLAAACSFILIQVLWGGIYEWRKTE